MHRDQYTAEQIALVLMQAALGFEYYMQDEFRLYDLGADDSRMLKPPEWVNHGVRLHEWCQERIDALGLGLWEQETFDDQLILDDFHPLARRVANASGPEGGKVAFLSLTTALILNAFTEYVSGEGRELADKLRGDVETYLRQAWGVDLVRGLVNAELAEVHLPQARETARRWCRRLELLTRPPIRAPLTHDQLAGIKGYQAAFGERNPWFLCLVKDCRRNPLHVDRNGLHCPTCADRRTWAWSWMADWSWQRRFNDDQG